MAGERVAVVTGASTGIGEAIARELARKGWHCVLLARRGAELERIAAEIGGEWEVCDVSDRGAGRRRRGARARATPRRSAFS